MAKQSQRGKAGAPSRKIKDPGPRIVDTAIELAEEAGWSGVRLRDVANRLNCLLRHR